MDSYTISNKVKNENCKKFKSSKNKNNNENKNKENRKKEGITIKEENKTQNIRIYSYNSRGFDTIKQKV